MLPKEEFVLGFGRVYDYAAGKSDRMAAGLPTAGAAAGRPTPATIARREVPTRQEGDVTAGSAIPVTTSANELIGLLVRGDAKRAVHEHQGGPS